MKRYSSPDQILTGFQARRLGKKGSVPVLLLAVGIPLLLYLAWPYAALWRIEQAVRGDDIPALSQTVDLASVRAEIMNRLNKESTSRIGVMSDDFIRWLEEGIGAMGSAAVEQLVTLEWVRTRLLDHSGGSADEGFLWQVSYAFFTAPSEFTVRIGPASRTPVRLRLALRGLRWRIVAIYY